MNQGTITQLEPKGKRWEVWRGSPLSASHHVRDRFRWRWMARLSAWSRTRAGWATYEVRDGYKENP